MGRVFTIRFRVEEVCIEGLVCAVCNEGEATRYSVRLLNGELNFLIEQGRFQFRAGDTELPAAFLFRDEAAFRLFGLLRDAIERQCT